MLPEGLWGFLLWDQRGMRAENTVPSTQGESLLLGQAGQRRAPGKTKETSEKKAEGRGETGGLPTPPPRPQASTLPLLLKQTLKLRMICGTSQISALLFSECRQLARHIIYTRTNDLPRLQ